MSWIDKVIMLVICTLVFGLGFSIIFLAMATFILPADHLSATSFWERLIETMMGLLGGYLLGIVSARRKN